MSKWLEITINGKTKKFGSGYAAWKWANQQSKNKLETKFDDKRGPFLSDFFARRHDQSKKKVK
jgi:hypothetical protein